jgi:hypothetical protein
MGYGHGAIAPLGYGLWARTYGLLMYVLFKGLEAYVHSDTRLWVENSY